MSERILKIIETSHIAHTCGFSLKNYSLHDKPNHQEKEMFPKSLSFPFPSPTLIKYPCDDYNIDIGLLERERRPNLPHPRFILGFLFFPLVSIKLPIWEK